MQLISAYLMRIFVVMLFLLPHSVGTSIELVTKQHDATTHIVTLTIDMDAGDFVDKNSFSLSVDHPDIQLGSWHSTTPTIKHYDATYKETRTVYNQPCTFEAQATTCDPEALRSAHLHVTFYQHSKKGMVHEVIPLMVRVTTPSVTTALDTSGEIKQEQTVAHPLPPKSTPECKETSWTARLSNLVETTNSNGIRIILVLLLGLLMSLTPCIYPMIPITVGILQAQGSKSVWHNLILSLAYTIGIATTFALLGLTAASTGTMFGSLMANPVFIIVVVGVLAYLGCSMLGFYDMYTPKFMRNTNTNKGGSIASAFLFGAASGTIASPCLSPGLILLLSIVATLGSKLLGFMLLFSFGIGLSIPLLIIGTFSTSLMILPRAGMWMIEVKKFFGLLLFAMCFYFLNNILSWPVLLVLITISSLGLGIFYFYSIASYDSKFWRTTKHLLGMSFVAGAVFVGMKAFQAFNTPDCPPEQEVWLHNFEQARTQAQTQQRPLLIDIGASYCSICKAIDRTIFAHPRVTEQIRNNFVAVKINAGETPEIVEELQKHYTIKGVPTILLINATTGAVIKQWGSELYDKAIDEFVKELASVEVVHS